MVFWGTSPAFALQTKGLWFSLPGFSPDGLACTLASSSDRPAVLALGSVDGGMAGLVKSRSDLVQLDAPSESDIATGVTPRADGMVTQVSAPKAVP